jgi:hypothetical protein
VALVVHDLRTQWRAHTRLQAGRLQARSPERGARRPERHARALAQLGRAETITNANDASNLGVMALA